MTIEFDVAALKRTRWHEYVIRFAFGGAVTALTGIIAQRFGPEIGGLFLAFPAVFPASLILIERHEKQKRQRAGMPCTIRARAIAGVNAAGTAMGALGLAAFAVVAWRWLGQYSTVSVLIIAMLAWWSVAELTWRAQKFRWANWRSQTTRADKPVRSDQSEKHNVVDMKGPVETDSRMKQKRRRSS